jgi:hypothetical protein
MPTGARVLAISFVLAIGATPAGAQSAGPAVYPVYAEMPGSMRNAEARKMFSAATARYGLGPVQVMDIAGAPAPRAPELLKTGMAAAEKLKFAEAESALDAAVAEVMSGGGAGMSAGGLADLFLYQAIAAQKATWKELEGAVTEIAPPKAREAYLRAAVLAPDRVLERRRYPPLAIASFQLAAAEVKKRPRGRVVVRASGSAEISVDGRAGQLSPAHVLDLPYGEHFVRVEDVGHQPWSAMVTLTMSELAIDAPTTAPLMPDDRAAAGHARRMGAAFALLCLLKLGARTELELHLVDASSGQVRNATVIPFAGDAAALDAAVMRLDEEGRRLALGADPGALTVPSTDLTVATIPASPPSVQQGPPLADDPGGWARRHWPLLTAIGATVATAIVLGIAVATDSRAPR